MACNTDYTPKPKAFIKLDFPEKVYEKLNVDCPFIFEFPVYSKLFKKENKAYKRKLIIILMLLGLGLIKK